MAVASVVARFLTVVVLVVLLQVTLLSAVRFGAASPDAPLLFAVAAGVAAGPDRGAITGFVTGLAYDVFLQTPFGLSALVYTVIAYAAGLLPSAMSAPSRGLRTLVIVIGSAVGVATWVVVGLVLGRDQLLGMPTWNAFLVVPVTGAVLALPAYALAAWVWRPLAPVVRLPRRGDGFRTLPARGGMTVGEPREHTRR